MMNKIDIPDKGKRKRVVIVGGGFGGLKLARKLKNDNFQIVLLDKIIIICFSLFSIR